MRFILTCILCLIALAQSACAQTPLASKTQSDPLTPGWQHDTVFYLLFVRSFADSTTGPLANDGVGDLQGIIERLDYLNDGDPTTTTDLGVTGLWLMPVAQSPSYHGYDATDYNTINADYGTNQDMRQLVEECHKRGIRVLVDLVVNHTSDQHPWFIESKDPDSPKRDWYVWQDDKPDQRGPWNQPVWHDRHADDGSTYYGVFWHGMPDLNYTNPDVTKAMHDTATYWLTNLGVDGFRLDAIMYLIEDGDSLKNDPKTIDWFRDFSAHVQSVKPGAFMVGEVWDTAEQITQYIDPAPSTPPALTSCFDFPFAYAVLEGLRDGNVERIRKDLARSYRIHANRASVFISNHDMDRSMPFMGSSIPKAKAAATLLLTAPGPPFIYYGEELGMIGQGAHENLRTPMQWTKDPKTTGFTASTPWQPPHRDTNKVSVQSQTDDPNSLLTHYRSLIHLRAKNPALTRGDLTMTAPNDTRIVAYVRTSENQRALVIVNGTDHAVTDFRINTTDLGLDPKLQRTDLITGQPVARLLPNHTDKWRPIPTIRPHASHIIVLD